MRLILISLARAPERRQKMTAQFDAAGLPFDILDATDGQKLTAAERALVDHRSRKSITPYPLSDNEIGCWLSHKRAIDSVASGPDRMAVIVEDDTKLDPAFAATLAALEQATQPFDFIFLHRKFKKGEIFAPCFALSTGNQAGRIGYMHMCCHAYVVSREGARKFLARQLPMAHAVDKAIHRYWANGLDIYGLEYPVAAQDDGGHSYIDETRGQDMPQQRARYPDADHPYWHMRRALTKLNDSLRKRLAFPSYVRQGKRSA